MNDSLLIVAAVQMVGHLRAAMKRPASARLQGDSTIVDDADFKNCRRCGSTKTAQSRRRWYDRWRAFASGKRPYRCFDCHRRFWASDTVGAALGDPHLTETR
jgi:hypothetical protein